MMLAGIPVANEGVGDLAGRVRDAGADHLAVRLEKGVVDKVKLLALTPYERVLMLAALEDPPQELAELRAVLLADYQWRRARGLV